MYSEVIQFHILGWPKSLFRVFRNVLQKNSWFADIFSHSLHCLFVLFVISFAVQKLISLIRSHLFIFVFMAIALEDLRKYRYDRVRECFAYVLF